MSGGGVHVGEGTRHASSGGGALGATASPTPSDHMGRELEGASSIAQCRFTLDKSAKAWRRELELPLVGVCRRRVSSSGGWIEKGGGGGGLDEGRRRE